MDSNKWKGYERLTDDDDDERQRRTVQDRLRNNYQAANERLRNSYEQLASGYKRLVDKERPADKERLLKDNERK